MKPAWILLTALLVCAVIYLGHKEAHKEASVVGTASATQQSGTSASPSPTSHRLADSMQRKLDHIRENGERSHPDPAPTVLTEEEVNEYFAAGKIKLPQGVKKVTLQGNDGVVNALVKVDFDEVRAGQRSSNPLLSIFSGVHDVQLDADVAGSGGEGKVHVRTVSIDSVEVPRMALEFFVAKFITPKYPNVGLDSTFAMPDKIDTATVGSHKLTITQK
jgi:hypothetical protein